MKDPSKSVRGVAIGSFLFEDSDHISMYFISALLISHMKYERQIYLNGQVNVFAKELNLLLIK